MDDAEPSPKRRSLSAGLQKFADSLTDQLPKMIDGEPYFSRKQLDAIEASKKKQAAIEKRRRTLPARIGKSNKAERRYAEIRAAVEEMKGGSRLSEHAARQRVAAQLGISFDTVKLARETDPMREIKPK